MNELYRIIYAAICSVYFTEAVLFCYSPTSYKIQHAIYSHTPTLDPAKCRIQLYSLASRANTVRNKIKVKKESLLYRSFNTSSEFPGRADFNIVIEPISMENLGGLPTF